MYLHRLSSGDVVPALGQVPGSAKGLSPTWKAEERAFAERDLSDVDFVYLWVDGIRVNTRLAGHKLCLLRSPRARSRGTSMARRAAWPPRPCRCRRSGRGAERPAGSGGSWKPLRDHAFLGFVGVNVGMAVSAPGVMSAIVTESAAPGSLGRYISAYQVTFSIGDIIVPAIVTAALHAGAPVLRRSPRARRSAFLRPTGPDLMSQNFVAIAQAPAGS